jgi:hypothetical protein
MIAARVRAVAFIRSGWVYAVRALGRAVGGSTSVMGAARMKGQAKGYGIPARPAINSTVAAEIGNSALLSEGARSNVAAKGLAAAMNRERAEMLAHLEKTLQPVLKKFSAP